MVTRIDRLARSIADLQDIVRAVRERGAALKATEQPIDTSTAAGKRFLDMLGVFAEFETNLRRERQLEGIAKAKAAGVYKGRPGSIDAALVRELKMQGRGAHRDCQGPQDRPGVGLPRIGDRLNATGTALLAFGACGNDPSLDRPGRQRGADHGAVAGHVQRQDTAQTRGASTAWAARATGQRPPSRRPRRRSGRSI
jgi:hypothetical protein